MIIERPRNFSPQRFGIRTLFLIVAVVAGLLFLAKYY
jgi:hypothetical protein